MISGVHHHCFRWCERCPFTDRCSNFSRPQEFEHEPLRSLPAAFPAMSKAFSSYWPALKKSVEAQGLGWKDFCFGLEQQNPSSTVSLSHDEAREMSKAASMDYMMISQSQPQWLPQTEELITDLGQAVACFRWYGVMVGAKFARIIGSADQGGYLSDLETDRPTAKLLHLILARLLAATAIIMEQEPEAAPALLPLVNIYCRLLHYLRINYPKAYLSSRTGFDNPRYSKEIRQFYQGNLPIDPFRDNSWSAGGRAPAE